MKRREPPPLATWMLRHLTAGDRDEALDGDLLEVFRLGRSNVWYWRQVTSACVISWCSDVYARGPALVFALLWSMLSPLWYATIGAIEASPAVDKASQLSGPLWLPLALIGWIALHAAFLWAGLLIYKLAHIVFRKPLQQTDLHRAFWIVLLIFPPVYGATFLIANLYWYSLPGLANANLVASSWGRIFDLGILANFIRFPYLVALVVALWGTVHRIGHEAKQIYADSTPGWTPTESDSTAVTRIPEPTEARRFLAFMVAAGLINSMIVALLLCSLPESQAASLGSLFASGLKFVVIGTLGGVVGSWLYWKSPASLFRRESPVPFSLFALTCATGWVWVPAMMLFAEQVSAAAAFVAMIGACMLAAGLRRATYFVFAPAHPKALSWEDGDLFSESLYRPPFEFHGYIIALSLFAAGAAIASRSNYTAAALLAMSAFIFAWKRTVPRSEALGHEVHLKRAVMRIACAVVPAVLLTMWALLNGVAHRNAVARAGAAASADAPAMKSVPPNAKVPFSASGVGGYESVVLWPFPKKKEIVPPLAVDDSLLAPRTKRPLIIRFNGPYWVLQPPSKRPGPEAHIAQGTPVNVHIESNNALALVMNAHQKLPQAIRIARCRQIEIEIENRDNKEGLVSLGVLLTDEESSPKRTLYLGQQPVVSTEPGHFFVKTTPAYDTLRFSVPHDAPMRTFNEITVMFLPDIEHTFVAPKIAILQFELLPR